MPGRNAIYAQSGGVTAVINATASAVIATARKHRKSIPKVLAARNGIVGVLREELIDTSRETVRTIERLRDRPGGAYGSCRFKLDGDADDPHAHRLLEVFKAHDVGYFFYNGGGDSQDTANKVDALGKAGGYPIQCIGIPKTVDNDLPKTDTCPGFGSVAKYVGVSVREAALDVESMCETSTKVFILEVMGRHAGWIAASGGLAGDGPDDPPHIILFPEIPFERERFLDKVNHVVDKLGYCVVVASEGARTAEGEFLSDSGTRDSFGHVQLGGVAAALAGMVQSDLGLKYHYAIADYLQRSARHIASKTDVEQAYAVGKAAVEYAVKGASGVMVVIKRLNDKPYRWRTEMTAIRGVANVERQVPRSYITKDGYRITARARRYLEPLVKGELYPAFKKGLPDYVNLKNVQVARKLPAYEV